MQTLGFANSDIETAKDLLLNLDPTIVPTGSVVDDLDALSISLFQIPNDQLPVPGDINGDGRVDCADLAIIKASFGKHTGQTGFDSRADVNGDGIVNVKDLAFVSQKIPAGTQCQ